MNLRRYPENVNRRSKMFNNRLVSPLNEAVYWVEYVMRQGGTFHSRSASVELTWYQYCLLDICLLFICLISVALYSFYWAIKLVSILFVKFSDRVAGERIKSLIKEENIKKD